MTTSPIVATTRRRWERLAYVAVGLLGVAVALVAFRPHTFSGAVIQSPSPAPALEGLTFHDGRPAELWRFDGDVTLLFFGYTHCPDICPTPLAAVARAKEHMGSDGERVHVVMVTVDPARDTADDLESYVTHFDPSFLGATGTAQALRSAATVYGIHVEVGEGTVDSGYTVDHTASLIAIDTDGFVRVVYPTDVAPDALASDLEELLG